MGRRFTGARVNSDADVPHALAGKHMGAGMPVLASEKVGSMLR